MAQEALKVVTVADAATRFLLQLNVTGEDRLQAQQEVNRFVRWLGSTRSLDLVSSHDVATYTERLGTTTSDIVSKLQPVKNFLVYAKKEGYTATNLGVNLRPKKSAIRGASGKVIKVAQTEKAYLTDDGYQQLVVELDGAKAERPKIAEALRLAMADKDFRENAPLDAARDQQAHLEARIRELEAMLKRAEIMAPDWADSARAQLGSSVVLWDVETSSEFRITLVHPHEANVGQGKVSVASPLGKAVLDRASGDDLQVAAPAGIIHYKINTVESGN